MVLVKNINSTHRADGISEQMGLHGALANANAKVDLKAWAAKNDAKSSVFGDI